MTPPMRRLNDGGREAFRHWLEGGATGTPPLELLDDPVMSDPLRLVIPRPHTNFESRYDLGVELVDLLDVLEVTEVQADSGLWDWLSLYLIDEVCPPDEAGRRKPGQIDRYLLQLDNHRTRYRHLVRTAWTLVRVHNSAARFILAGPLHVHGEAAEQLGAYQEVITCKPLIERSRLLRGMLTGRASNVGSAAVGRGRRDASRSSLSSTASLMIWTRCSPRRSLISCPRNSTASKRVPPRLRYDGRRSRPDRPGANRVPTLIRPDHLSGKNPQRRSPKTNFSTAVRCARWSKLALLSGSNRASNCGRDEKLHGHNELGMVHIVHTM